MNLINADFERYLVGDIDVIDASFFSTSNSAITNENTALSLMRYVIEKILCWNPELIPKKFDRYTLNTMKLDYYCKYIQFPDEIKDNDTDFLLSLLYPNLVSTQVSYTVENMYKSVLRKERQFPRGYFYGYEGFLRLCVCLQYLLVHYKPFTSVPDIYYFLLSSTGRKFLYDYRLLVPQIKTGISIIDMIGTITENMEHGEYWYEYFKFLNYFHQFDNIEDIDEDDEEPEEHITQKTPQQENDLAVLFVDFDIDSEYDDDDVDVEDFSSSEDEASENHDDDEADETDDEYEHDTEDNEYDSNE